MAARFPFPTVLVATLLVCYSLGGCNDGRENGSSGNPIPGDKIRAIVSVAPQADFVRRVGGKRVLVDVLVGSGQDPHAYSPTPSQMTALGKAHLLFTVGMPFEEALAKKIAAANSAIKVVDTGAGFDKIALQCDHPEHADEDHPAHGDEDEDGHEPDPHIWLAPIFIKAQAAHIEAALAAAMPEHAEEFSTNRAAFDAELDSLHAELSKQMEPFIGEQFFVFHPAFGYFGHTYGIEQVAVEIGGNAPTLKELATFIEHAKEEGVKVLFVQPQFDSRSAETVADALGAKVVALDPLARDVLPNLRRIADAIAGGFSDQ